MKKITIIMIVLSFISCQCSTNKGSEKAAQIQKPDLALELLDGNWFMPHNADINITFNRDSTFVFNDFNVKLLKEEVLKGKFQLRGNKLILIYNDRPKQIFIFDRGGNEDDNYYIKKGNYYFVKSDIIVSDEKNSNCGNIRQ